VKRDRGSYPPVPPNAYSPSDAPTCLALARRFAAARLLGCRSGSLGREYNPCPSSAFEAYRGRRAHAFDHKMWGRRIKLRDPGWVQVGCFMGTLQAQRLLTFAFCHSGLRAGGQTIARPGIFHRRNIIDRWIITAARSVDAGQKNPLTAADERRISICSRAERTRR
jgi:hypothetical protein